MGGNLIKEEKMEGSDTVTLLKVVSCLDSPPTSDVMLISQLEHLVQP